MTRLFPLVISTVTPSYSELVLANTDSRIYVNIISKTQFFLTIEKQKTFVGCLLFL